MTYFQRLEAAKNNVVIVLTAKGIDPRYLSFGGPGEVPTKRPSVPAGSRSEFLANRAMGDSAEKILAAACRAACNQWQLTHYGNTEEIAAGEHGFRDFYLTVLEEVRNFGKRPDLLVFPRERRVEDDISAKNFAEVDALVEYALGAMEVRSSKFEALRYMQVRRSEREEGKRGLSTRAAPSFTVKVEDLKIVYRWIERHRKPQAYVQVFFDSVFMINVLRIFEIIASDCGFVIEKPKKSQEKATIMIPITSGVQVGYFRTLPRFDVAERVTRLGRHDAYVQPIGGDLQVDCEQIAHLLLD